MTQLIINRAKWGRGKATNKDGSPCCVIGHAHAQLTGFDQNNMPMKIKFSLLHDYARPEGMRWIGKINDELPDGPERELAIATIAATIGVTVEYVGEYPS